MKKLLCFVLTVFMCISGLTVSAADAVIFEFGDVAGTPGDVNVDTYINATDLSALSKILLNVTKVQSKLTADVNEDTFIDIRDKVRLKKNMAKLGILTDGAREAETHLSNAYKLATMGEKKLTLGYLGGSITYGVGATYDGTIDDSWVNLTSSWFSEQFPDAVIETVNAGLPDTATNYALYRLEKCLMNTNGHGMPDVVFVEFTNNDWITSTQSSTDLECQIESLFRNIYLLNPCAEIIVISTVRTEAPSRTAYLKVAESYGIPVVDVGFYLQEKMTERGYAEESSGNYYYTADNLHPSAKGYGVYFEKIMSFLEENTLNLSLKSNFLYNYGKNMPDVITANYISSPKILPASSLSFSGNAAVSSAPLTCEIYGTDKTLDKIEIVSDTVSVTGQTVLTANFTGSALGLLFSMSDDTNINLTYSIDGGAQKTFAVNENSMKFQRYNHSQVFMLAHSLGSGSHTVEITFGGSDKCTLAALLTNQKTY